MKYRGTVTIPCPMCNFANQVPSVYLELEKKAESGMPFILLCDSEEGGCDRYFVVKIDVHVKVTTFKYDD